MKDFDTLLDEIENNIDTIISRNNPNSSCCTMEQRDNYNVQILQIIQEMYERMAIGSLITRIEGGSFHSGKERNFIFGE